MHAGDKPMLPVNFRGEQLRTNSLHLCVVTWWVQFVFQFQVFVWSLCSYVSVWLCCLAVLSSSKHLSLLFVKKYSPFLSASDVHLPQHTVTEKSVSQSNNITLHSQGLWCRWDNWLGLEIRVGCSFSLEETHISTWKQNSTSPSFQPTYRHHLIYSLVITCMQYFIWRLCVILRCKIVLDWRICSF